MSLHAVAEVSILAALFCALLIALDELRHPQEMAVMDVVWPLTALYFGALAVIGYFAVGRQRAPEAGRGVVSEVAGEKRKGPTLAEVAIGASHCGAGCMLADMGCGFLLSATRLQIFGSRLIAEYIVDFIAAWTLGVAFQYFAIKPMRPELSRPQAIGAAIKADTLSIAAFQVGMYAWMAIVQLLLFRSPRLEAFDPRYWLMMQAGMVVGFVTCMPMNWLLISRGWKEAM